MRFLALLALLVPGVVCGATVVPDTKIAFGPVSSPFADYRARVDQDLLGDYTETSFSFNQISATEYSLGVTLVALDEEADWYLVEAGDLFTKESIAGGEFTPLFTTDQWFPAVTVGSDFYLGVNTGNWAGDVGGFETRDVFGWVHLRVVAGDLVMVGNVLSFGGGLVVGVPEPSCFALACFGCLFFRRGR